MCLYVFLWFCVCVSMCQLFAPTFVCANPPASTLCADWLLRLFTSTSCTDFLRQLVAPSFYVELCLCQLFAPTFVCANPPRRLCAPTGCSVFYVNFLHRRFASTCCSVFLRRTLSVSTFRADFCLRQPPRVDFVRRLVAPFFTSTSCTDFLRQLVAPSFYVELCLCQLS